MRKIAKALYIFPTILLDDVIGICGKLEFRSSSALFMIAFMDEEQVEQVEAFYPNTVTRMR